MEKSVVVISGGQDSVTTFFQARTITDIVGLIHFQYGQQHSAAELAAISKLCNAFGETCKVVDLSALKEVAVSALTKVDGDTTVSHPHNANLPASFVPGRNLVMLTLAAAYAQSLGSSILFTGVCETDSSGYPDCRDTTIRRLEETIRLGMDIPHFAIHTPLMYLDKADTFMLAYRLNELAWIIENTHTCYVGNHELRHVWGYGCGECPACLVRAQGWNTFVERYPLLAKTAIDGEKR